MRRRAFIAGLGGAAAWPVTARAQQGERVRRVGIVIGGSESDPEVQSWLAAFVQELGRLRWVEGRNVRIDRHWTNDDADLARLFAKQLVALRPDVVLTFATPATAALQRETRTIPIVFASVVDPVGQGFVAGLPRPGGNLTGFSAPETVVVGKQLQMIKEIVPGIRRVAAMYNPDFAPWAKSLFDAFEAAAQVLAMDPIIVPVHSDAEIEAAIDALGRAAGGLISLSDSFMNGHRAVVTAAATRNRVPAIYISFRRYCGPMWFLLP
jgi:putative tryptophan/tyrosine transport system substrate-binding protein